MDITPTFIIVLLVGTLVIGILGLLAVRETAYRTSEMEASARGDVRTDRLGDLRRRVNGRVRRTGWGRRLDLKLAGASLSIGPFDFAALVLVLAVGAAVSLHGFMGYLGSALVVAAILASANKWLDTRRTKRINEFVSQLPDLARLLANATSAGLALRTGVDLVVKELPDPARTEFVEIQRQMALGQSLDSALTDLNARLPSRELDVLVRTLVIQSQAGGRLTSALATIAATLEDRRDLQRELRTAVSGAVFSGYMVLMIGVGSVFLMNVVNPGSLDLLAANLIGQIVLGVAAALFGMGFLLIRRITSVDV